MNIRFVSSLTPDDESRLAAAIVVLTRGLLDPFNLPYTIRIETADGQILHQSNAPTDLPARVPAVSDVVST